MIYVIFTSKHSVFFIRTSAIALSLLMPHMAWAGSEVQDVLKTNEGKEASEASQEIVVTARSKGPDIKIDRVVFEIEAKSDAASLTTIDVLRKLPGLIVDSSRRILFRGGANVGFLIDGKSSRRDVALTIPASQIARVELISNPPADYDSDVDALINIILKKDAELGLSGSVSGKLDTLSGYRSGVNLNYGGKAWTFNSSLSARVEPEPGTRLRQFDYNTLQPGGFNSQTLITKERQSFRQISGQGKLVGRLSDNKTLSLVFGASLNKNPQRNTGIRTVRSSDLSLDRPFTRVSNFRGFYPYATITYESGKDDESYFKSSIDGTLGRSDEIRRLFEVSPQLFSQDIEFSFVEASIERRKKFNNKSAYLIGAKVSNNSVNENLLLSGFSGPNQNQSNDYRFNRNIYSIYFTYETTALGIGIKSGIRFENVDQTIRNEFGRVQGDRGSTFILPSLNLAYEVDKKSTLKASFTTRVEKPDALNLNPFEKFFNSFQVESGNPFLKPSEKRQLELSFDYQSKKFNLNSALYYRDTNKDFVKTIFLDRDGIIKSSFVNLGSSDTYGYNGNIKVRLNKKIDMLFDLDLFIKNLFVPISQSLFEDVSFIGLNSTLSADYNIDNNNTISAKLTYTGSTSELNLLNSDAWASEISYGRKFAKGFSLSVAAVNFFVPTRTSARFAGSDFTGFDKIDRDLRLIRIGISKEF
jgi:ferric enterobactin receptor